MPESSVTATSSELTVPRRGVVAALQDSMPRNELFAGLFILGCANGLVGRSILTFNLEGWTGAVLVSEMNIVVLAACFACLYLIATSNQERIQSLDLVVALGFLGLVIVPIYAASWVGVAGLSLYMLLFANDGAERKRGAVTLLVLTVPMLCSRLLFQ